MTSEATTAVQRRPNGMGGPDTRNGPDARSVTRGVLRFLAWLARTIAQIFAAILVIHLVLALIPSSNKGNSIALFFSYWADQLTLGFGTLFVPVEQPLNMILNYGVAAIAWLIFGAIASRLLHALIPRGGRW